MKTLRGRRSKPTSVSLFVVGTLPLMMAVTALADEFNGPPFAIMGAALGAILLVSFLIIIASYIYGALALQTIAEKTRTENAWWAWVPIANAILLAKIARKPNWWGILMIVPFVNLIVPGYLAWAD